MMFIGVMGLAAVMVAAGGTAIFNGWEMVLNERGWSQVIAGAVILSTGLLIIALGGLLAHLKAFLVKVLASQSAPVVREDPVVPGDTAHEMAAVRSVAAIDNHSHLFETPAPVVAGPSGEVASLHDAHPVSAQQTDLIAPPESPPLFAEFSDPKTEPKSEPFDPVYKPARAQHAAREYRETEHRESARSHHDLLADLTPQPVPMPTPKPDQWAQMAHPDTLHADMSPVNSWSDVQPSQVQPSPSAQPSLLDRLAQEIEPHPAVPPGQPPFTASYEPRRPIMPPAPTAPAMERELVASYTAGGVGYFMYSDQTIEAEMAIGRYRFASMDELRHFVETNEGGVRVGESSQI